MNYHAGDTVMHWMHGLGKIVRRERRSVLGQQALYYAVSVGNMIVWVPIDESVSKRLRRPAGRVRFRRLIGLLSKPGETLPVDRHERKMLLAAYLQDGRLESLIRVARALLSLQHIRSLNENDQAVMRRVQASLQGEWGHVMDLTPAEAESQLGHVLKLASR